MGHKPIFVIIGRGLGLGNLLYKAAAYHIATTFLLLELHI